MKKMAVIFALTGLIIGCGDSEPNVDIETYNKVNQLFRIKYVEVKVKAISDEVTVDDVIVNRGNCKIENKNTLNGKPILPKQLRFGESVSVSFSGPCEAAQVDVVTDDGSWTVSY